MHSVVPLKPDGRHRDTATKAALATPNRQANETHAADYSESEALFRTRVVDAIDRELPLLREGYPRKYLRQLGSRECPVTDSFDLHGMKEHAAAKALARFLRESLQHNLSCVRVVHGKGLRSEGPAVLKLMSWQLLWQHPEVLALKHCRPADGGTGAVLVMLKTVRKSAS